MSRFELITTDLNFIIRDNTTEKEYDCNTDKGRIELLDLMNMLDSEISTWEYEDELKPPYHVDDGDAYTY